VSCNVVGSVGQVTSFGVQGIDGPEGIVETRRDVHREKCKEIDGAQHGGTVRGFGAINGSREWGRRRWLAERSNSAVVKVIAKATANLS
jgi:hypothetical protein